MMTPTACVRVGGWGRRDGVGAGRLTLGQTCRPGRVEDADLALVQLLFIGDLPPRQLPLEVAHDTPVYAGELHLGVTLQDEDIPQRQPCLLGRCGGQLGEVLAAHEKLARPIADLPCDILGQASARCGRVDTVGGYDAVEEAPEGALARRHCHDDILPRAGGSDTVAVAEEGGELLGEGADLSLGEDVLGMAGFGVEGRVLFGSAVLRLCRELAPGPAPSVSRATTMGMCRGGGDLPKRRVRRSRLGTGTTFPWL